MRTITPAIIALCLIATGPTAAEDLAPREVLARTLALHDGVQDYTAHVRVTTDIPDFDIPVREFTVYIKRPDKVKIESTGLVIVPKDVLLLGDLKRHLAEAGQVTLAGVNREGSRPLYCLKITPEMAAKRDRLLLWVEDERWTLTKTELWGGANRYLTVYWKHVQVNERFWMPAEVKCEISGGVLRGARPGTITVTFTDYRVNTGLSDELFESKDR